MVQRHITDSIASMFCIAWRREAGTNWLPMHGPRHALQSWFCVLTLLCSTPLLADTAAFSAAASPEFKQVVAPRVWSFPRDHGRHDGYKTEWWYFTGNLRDATGRRFGYQLTFFRTAITPQAATRPSGWAMTDLYFAHAAISDIDGHQFAFKDHLQRGRTGLAESSDQTMNVTLLDWSAVLDDKGVTRLVAHDPGFSIDLRCEPGIGPVLQGAGGVNAKGRNLGQASYYYSEPHMPTTGSFMLVDKKYDVQGESWMDHEFSSNALGADQVGWDWMGLTMNDGSALMIYRLRNRSGATDYLSGTLISAGGKPRYLTEKEIAIESSEPWKSSESNAAYPQQWRVKVLEQRPFIIQSLLRGQELITKNSTDVNYFEGAVSVTSETGHAIGLGYLEMTGYAKSLTGEAKH